MVEATALVLTRHGEDRRWRGNIWVDKPNGNEDPLVFVKPWVYTYCHATQLKRVKHRESPFVQRDSCLIFCSGSAADHEILQIDTVFLVGDVAEWNWGKKIRSPEIFKQHEKNPKSRLWQCHLRYGTGKQHKGRFTYLSTIWKPGALKYSFLPLDSNGDRTSLSLDLLTPKIGKTILDGVRGKIPVLLDDVQIIDLLGQVDLYTTTKVVKNIRRTETTDSSKDLRDACH